MKNKRDNDLKYLVLIYIIFSIIFIILSYYRNFISHPAIQHHFILLEKYNWKDILLLNFAEKRGWIYAFLIKTIDFFINNRELSANIINGLVSTFLIFPLFYFVKELFNNKKISYYTIFFTLLTPVFLELITFPNDRLIILPFQLGIAYYLLKFSKTNIKKFYVIGLFLFIFSMYFRPSGYMYGIFLLLPSFPFIKKIIKEKNIKLFVLFGIIIFFFFFTFYKFMDERLIRYFNKIFSVSLGKMLKNRINIFEQYILMMPYVLDYIGFTGIIYILFMKYKKYLKEIKLFTLFFIFWLLPFFIHYAVVIWYYITLLPYLIIIFSMFLVDIERRFLKFKFLKFSLTILSFIIFLFFFIFTYKNTYDLFGNIKRSGQYILNNKIKGRILTTDVGFANYWTKRKTLKYNFSRIKLNDILLLDSWYLSSVGSNIYLELNRLQKKYNFKILFNNRAFYKPVTNPLVLNPVRIAFGFSWYPYKFDTQVHYSLVIKILGIKKNENTIN